MEAGSCVKAVVVSGNQYRNNPSDTHLVHLQRHLDVLISITAKGSCITYFDPTQLLPTECLAVLVDILSDTVRPSLALKTMMLLSNLGNEDEIRVVLHQTFNVSQSLAKYIKISMASPSDPVTLQALKLMLKVTYNTRISFQETYIEDLLKFIIKQIQGKESEATESCLGLMANLCRHSFSIQTHIKSMENIKSFYKCLVHYLSHNNQTIVVFALSILASLWLHEEVGDMIFSGQNINQTFQLMFNNLINGSTFTSRKYVVDLFVDLMKHAKIQQLLAGYDHLEPCLRQVLGLISTAIPEAAVKIFELLLCLCLVNGLRPLVCRCLLDWSVAGGGGVMTSAPFLAIIKWAYHSPNTHDRAPLLAMHFLTEISEEALDTGRTGQIQDYCTQLLPMITETLMAPLERDKHAYSNMCRKVVQAAKLLQTLCNDDGLRTPAAHAVNTKICGQLIEYQLENNTLGLTSQPLEDPHQANARGAEVVLCTLDLMHKIKHHVVHMEAQFTKYLQDPRCVPFLTYGMTSDSREIVQITLRLVLTASALPEFPSILLGDSIAAKNSTGSRSSDLDPGPLEYAPPPAKRAMWNLPGNNKENRGLSKQKTPVTPARPLAPRDTTNTSSDLDSSVQTLIEKMQTGMELKDLRASEIINVYEHQLQSLQTKENHLQDLLEAKALALTQADRLIAQFRCRKAQSEAEATKLRSLVRESEKRSEECREQYNEVALERENMTTEIENLMQENARLEQIEEEHKELVQIHNDQTQRLESTQHNLATLKQEQQTLTEMHEMLRRHNESLKERASKQLAELEDERKNFNKQLKEKETKLQETIRALQKAEDRLKKISKERDDLENAIDNFRESLAQTEQAKKSLQHEVSSLEVVCLQHEEAIKAKDDSLQALKTELDKHAQIAALIHNLSSGNAPASMGKK